jgi:hypothetical protein
MATVNKEIFLLNEEGDTAWAHGKRYATGNANASANFNRGLDLSAGVDVKAGLSRYQKVF